MDDLMRSDRGFGKMKKAMVARVGLWACRTQLRCDLQLMTVAELRRYAEELSIAPRDLSARGAGSNL